MSEILGHDVDGRPLRAGDRVEILRTTCVKGAEFAIGQITVVIGESRHPRFLKVGIVGVLGQVIVDPRNGLRRIDDRPELGSWDEIEKITGWNPTKQPAEA